MKLGRFRNLCKAWGLATLLSAGCVSTRTEFERSLKQAPSDPVQEQDVLDHYLVNFPDVLDIQIPDRPELSHKYPIDIEGRIDLANYGFLRIEGNRVNEVARKVAQVIGAERRDVRVGVAEYRSQHVVLFGQVVGWQRVIPYQGQERVVEVLKRCGGVTKVADIDAIHVVRTHVFDGKRPELFKVNLEAILEKDDQTTNVRLMPFDQIHVGESKQVHIEQSLPRWMKPMYQLFWDTRPGRAELRAEAREEGRMPWLVGSSVEPKNLPKKPGN